MKDEVLSPARFEALLSSLRADLDWLTDENEKCAQYRFVHSGVDGVRSREVGSIGRSGHADPVGARKSRREYAQCSSACRALRDALRAVQAVRRALEDQQESEPAEIGPRGTWVPKAEREFLLERQARRNASGGYGAS